MLDSKGLKNLEELILDNLSIKSYPNQHFSKLKNLKTLSLKNNFLKDVPRDVLNLPKLKKITFCSFRMNKKELRALKQKIETNYPNITIDLCSIE